MAAPTIPAVMTFNYRGQALTVAEATLYCKRIEDLRERYDAQMDVGTLIMEQQSKGEDTAAEFMEYIDGDKARTTIDPKRFKADWKELRKIAARSYSTKDKMEGAKATILKNWGQQAIEMASAPTYNTRSKIRQLALKIPNYANALPRINQAVIERLRYYTAIKKPWELGPQAADYDRAREEGDLPPFTLVDLNHFKLY